jgi:hypothetical protein
MFLQYEILNTLGRIVPDVCEITVGLGKTYKDEVQYLKYQAKLINDSYTYKN